MKTSVRIVVFIVALVGASLSLPAQGGSPPGHYIVVLNSGDPGAVAAEHARDHGAQVAFTYRHAVRGYAAAIPDHRVAAIEADERVAYVTEDRPVHASSHSAGNAPTGVHRAFAPDNQNIDIDGIDDLRVDADVAVIDTGIDVDHPDLNVVGGRNCQKGKSYDDGNGHGTHVAGSAGGLDNGVGVVGVAPGARLWAVRVLDNSGNGSWSSVLCGVDWVTAQNTDSVSSNDIEVANMSLGGSGSEPAGAGCATGNALHDGICKSVTSGATYVVAAGNESDDAANHVPAAYDEVITVSALADFDGITGGLGLPTCRTDVDDTFAGFSNYGPDIDIIAPGVCIRSTWKDGGYNTISGTSMAAPHVAGAAALYMATNASASPADVKAALQSSANYDWSAADDRDAVKEGLLDVRASLVFAPTMVAGAAAGDGGSTEPPPTKEPASDFTLTATGYKVKGTQKADLKWSGSSAAQVDVWRNGGSGYGKVATLDNVSPYTYTDHINAKGGGSYTYKVCDAGTTTCSNEATVTF